MIRPFEHTGDVGFELKVESLDQLFNAAMRGLVAVMFAAPPGQGSLRKRLRLVAPGLEALMVAWLNEVIFLIQTKEFVPVSCQLVLELGTEGWKLEADLKGMTLDLAAFGWQGEVKNATYHGLAIKQLNERWQARVVLDV